jgi:uncharacterized protein (TIGR02611 family)
MATEDAAGGAPVPPDDPPELLIKLRERRERHKQRNLLQRIGIVILGILVVIAGIILTLPGVPGPGIVTILFGLGFLALEFDWAERWMERVIVWGDRAAERAEHSTTRQRVIAGVGAVLAAGAFVIAAILWDIPLVPVL